MDHHPAKEALFHLRELNNSSVRETKYRSPTAAMNEIHATLVWYERARDEARAQSLAKNKKGKKVFLPLGFYSILLAQPAFPR